jgi:hypothetical protein
MTQPVTDETTPDASLVRTFEVEAVLTVKVELGNGSGGADADAEIEARRKVDEILQRAWDTDRGRHHVESWHFELLDGGLITDVTEELTP